jgi:hypothetical protein
MTTTKRSKVERAARVLLCQGTASAVPKAMQDNPALAAEVLFQCPDLSKTNQ